MLLSELKMQSLCARVNLQFRFPAARLHQPGSVSNLRDDNVDHHVAPARLDPDFESERWLQPQAVFRLLMIKVNRRDWHRRLRYPWH